MNSFSEENYLKAVYKLSEMTESPVYTTELAKKMGTSSASVTDMLQKLARKKFIMYKKYQGVRLTEQGKKTAVNIIRKHRLWELFLVTKLGFRWDEVHDMAEQLEHIQSDLLVHRLDDFLGKPKFDPHGDPIPDENGIFHSVKNILLSDVKESLTVTITGVVDHHPSFLQYLDKNGLSLGKKVKVKELIEYDKSMQVLLNRKMSALHISHEVAKNILVTL